MNAIEQRHYRGVICLHCKEPIPIPSSVASIEADDESKSPRDQKCQVFNLRCAKCGKEKPYRVREIVDIIEDTDRGPVSSPSSYGPSRLSDRSKAANA